MQDEMIIELFCERSEHAIVELSAKYGRMAQSICSNILKNSSDAEECVNDSLFTMWNLIPPNKPMSLRAYFINVVRNKALDRYRYNSAPKRNSYYDIALDELEECLNSPASPVREVEESVLSDAINKFLGSIKKEDRVMFVSRYFLSESNVAIAQKMNLKETAVRLRLHRTRNKLRKFLEKENLI